ncbi:MAG: FixH family protein, partial [Natronosporangium sp.]
ASVLVATPPGVVVSAGERPAAQAAAPPSPVFAEVAFDGGMAIVQVTPAQVGANQLSVELVAVSGEPVEVPEIRASLMLPAADLGPLPVELTEVEPGGYRAVDAQLPAAGEWLLDLTIRTSEIDSSTVQVDVPVS